MGESKGEGVEVEVVKVEVTVMAVDVDEVEVVCLCCCFGLAITLHARCMRFLIAYGSCTRVVRLFQTLRFFASAQISSYVRWAGRSM